MQTLIDLPEFRGLQPSNCVLALDLATTTGYAHSAGPSGSWLLKSRKEPVIMRIVGIWHQLSILHRRCPFALIVAEEVHVHYITAAISLCELRGAVMAWCVWKGVKFVGNVSAATIKLHATGNGAASKSEMQCAWYDKTGIKIESEDEADALWLLDYHLSL